MPKFEIDHELKLIYWEAGDFDINALNEAIVSIEALDPTYTYGILLDRSVPITPAPSLQEVKVLAGILNRHRRAMGNRKVAWHVTDDLRFAVGRQIGATVDNLGMDSYKPFRSREAAIRWLTAENEGLQDQ